MKQNAKWRWHPVSRTKRKCRMYNSKGEVVIYNPGGTIRIEVRVESETVWLTQAQLGLLFGVDRSVIVKHIGNIYRMAELDEETTCAKIAQVQIEGGRKVSRIQNYYNMDMILSVGYRVNSRNATSFRRWASSVLKEYLLRGYAIHSRVERLEQRVAKTEEKIDFFVRTSLPPVEGIFYEGQIFDAYTFATGLISRAEKAIILIDNYVDETVLKILDKRRPSVKAEIFTKHLSDQLQLDIIKHNAQYDPIIVREFGGSHDRFLMIDDQVFHIGASLKDLGKKWFAFSLMRDLKPVDLMKRINKKEEAD